MANELSWEYSIARADRQHEGKEEVIIGGYVGVRQPGDDKDEEEKVATHRGQLRYQTHHPGADATECLTTLSSTHGASCLRQTLIQVHQKWCRFFFVETGR